MAMPEQRNLYSIKAKIIFAFIPVLILIMIEIMLRMLVPVEKDQGKISAIPDLFLAPYTKYPDNNVLLSNFNLLYNPVEKLPFHQYDEDLWYSPKPDSSFSFLIPKSYTITYSINSHGFRGDEFKLDKPENKLRIICAGDSSTFGFNVNNNDTYPKQLEMILEKETTEKNAEVINAGILAFNSLGGVLYLEKKLRKLDPDILVFSYGFNDSFFRTRPLKKNSLISKVTGTLLEKGLFKLAIYRILDESFRKFNSKKVSQDLDPNVRPDEFIENLEKVCKLCREDGIHLVFMPISVNISYGKIMKEIAERFEVGHIDVEKTLEEHYYRFKREGSKSYKGIRFGKLKKKPFKDRFYKHFNSLDMMKIREFNYVFMDYCHPSPAGYHIIAEEIYKYLVDNGYFTQNAGVKTKSEDLIPEIEESSFIPGLNRLK